MTKLAILIKADRLTHKYIRKEGKKYIYEEPNNKQSKKEMLSYKDYSEHINRMAEKIGKNEYYSSEEYKMIYPEMMRLYKEEGHQDKRNKQIANKKKLNKQIREGTKETGFPVGLFTSSNSSNDALKKSKNYKCPECKKSEAYYKEIHADTDMNDVVLYCPDCKLLDEDHKYDLKKSEHLQHKYLRKEGDKYIYSENEEKQSGLEKRADGFYYTEGIKISKDKEKAEQYLENKKKRKEGSDKPIIKVGEKIRIKPNAKTGELRRHEGRGVIATIKEIGKDFVRVMNEAGDMFRVPIHAVEFAKSIMYIDKLKMIRIKDDIFKASELLNK